MHTASSAYLLLELWHCSDGFIKLRPEKRPDGGALLAFTFNGTLKSASFPRLPIVNTCECCVTGGALHAEVSGTRNGLRLHAVLASPQKRTCSKTNVSGTEPACLALCSSSCS